MDHLPANTGHNTGGMLQLLLIPSTEVISISPPTIQYIVPSIQLASESVIGSIEFIPESCGLAEKGKVTEHGFLYDKRIPFSVARSAPDVHAWIHKYAHLGFIALARDGNSTINIVGDKHDPLYFIDIGIDTKTKPSGRNEYDFMLGTTHSYPSHFYAMFEYVAEVQRKIFDNTFDFTFE